MGAHPVTDRGAHFEAALSTAHATKPDTAPAASSAANTAQKISTAVAGCHSAGDQAEAGAAELSYAVPQFGQTVSAGSSRRDEQFGQRSMGTGEGYA